MISHHWSFILRKTSEPLKKECFIDGSLRHPPCYLPMLAIRKESPRARVTGSVQEWRRPDMKDGDVIGSTFATVQDSPHSWLIHHQKKISEHQTKKLIWLDRRSVEQIKSKHEPSLSFLAAIFCHKNWCFATRLSWRLIHYANRLHYLHPLPLFSPSDEEEGKPRSLPEQEVWGQGTLDKMSRLLPRFTLFIDGETRSSPIQILNHPQRVGLYQAIYSMSN